MDGRLDEALDGIVAACAATAAALDTDDLEAAGLGDQDLKAKLAGLALLIDELAAAVAAPAFAADAAVRAAVECSIATVTARLSGVLERHDAIARRLRDERDRTAAELDGVQSGRRAATHYLDTAASSTP
jgi:hypothetical protein